MLMFDALNSFIEWKTLGHKKATIRGYSQDIRILCLYLHNPDVAFVTIDHIIGMINSMLVLGWDENSFIHKSSAYRRFFAYCKMRGYSTLDPELIPIPKQTFKIPRVAKEEDYRRLLSFIPENNDPRHIRNKAILNMLWDTGMRIEELLSLDVKDLDFVNNKAVVRTEKSRGKRPFREIMWREESAKSLKEWIAKREALQKKGSFEGKDALFISVTSQKFGCRLTKSGSGEAIRRYCNKAGIPYMNHHSFRHAFCHDIVKKGGSAADVMNLAGHSSVQSSTPYIMMFGKELEERYRALKG